MLCGQNSYEQVTSEHRESTNPRYRYLLQGMYQAPVLTCVNLLETWKTTPNGSTEGQRKYLEGMTIAVKFV
jgi:hypothetical protein